MTIENIKLYNFQGHGDSLLELSPGVNIIWGSSDHGKSSIIRALRWVCKNEPNGDEFRKEHTDKTEVTVETDNFIVQRRRTDNKNEYEMDEDVYKALRTSVPEDISKALNIKEKNIQSQHEVYFLIDKSPGQRAKTLNEVAGLGIMDKANKRINELIRSINSSIKNKESEIEEDEKDVKNLSWVISADAFLKKLENYQESINSNEDFLSWLNETINEIKKLESQKNKLLSDKALKEIKEMVKEEKDIIELEKRKEKILSTVHEIKRLEKQTVSVIDVSELRKLQDKIDISCKKYNRIVALIEQIKTLKDQYKQGKEELKISNQNVQDELKRLGKCPTCGTIQ